MPKSLKAKDVMTKEVFTVGPEATLAETINKLIENKISGMPVIDDNGKMVGIISEKDILNFAFCGYLHNTKVQQAMTKDVIHFTPDTDIEKIALAIAEKHFRRVPIIENDKVVGIVSRRDIIYNVLKLTM